MTRPSRSLIAPNGVTEPGFTVATGAGGYFTPPEVAVSEGQFLHVRKGAAGAP